MKMMLDLQVDDHLCPLISGLGKIARECPLKEGVKVPPMPRSICSTVVRSCAETTATILLVPTDEFLEWHRTVMGMLELSGPHVKEKPRTTV